MKKRAVYRIYCVNQGYVVCKDCTLAKAVEYESFAQYETFAFSNPKDLTTWLLRRLVAEDAEVKP